MDSSWFPPFSHVWSLFPVQSERSARFFTDKQPAGIPVTKAKANSKWYTPILEKSLLKVKNRRTRKIPPEHSNDE